MNDIIRNYKEKLPIISSISKDDIFIKKNEFLFIAGPCAIEDDQMAVDIFSFLNSLKLNYFRVGAFKPRTSPYSFQGLGNEGIKIVQNIKRKNNYIVSEIMSEYDINYFLNNVDIIQVGSRNMQNYSLLKKLGQISKPILLKRGYGSTLFEWLSAAEYIAKFGNKNIILVERGIRTFETSTRFTLDLNSLILAKKITNLPIIVDPSHSSGNYELVNNLSLSGISAGCDGLIIEVHNNPKIAMSDGPQSLNFTKFKKLFEESSNLIKYFNKIIKE